MTRGPQSAYSYTRHQRLAALRRKSDGLYWTGRSGSEPRWVKDIRLANFGTPQKLGYVVTIDFGLPVEKFEMVPPLISGAADALDLPAPMGSKVPTTPVGSNRLQNANPL